MTAAIAAGYVAAPNELVVAALLVALLAVLHFRSPPPGAA